MLTPTPEIRKALYGHLLKALPIGSICETDIAWPNALFQPVVGRMFLAPTCEFSETETASLSPAGFEKLSGRFQISIYGVLNQGEAEIDEAARALVDIFRGGTVLPVPCFNPLHIHAAYRSGLRVEGDGESTRPVVSVSVNWFQYTQKGE